MQTKTVQLTVTFEDELDIDDVCKLIEAHLPKAKMRCHGIWSLSITQHPVEGTCPACNARDAEERKPFIIGDTL